MDKLLESLELLNNISDFTNINEVKEIALKAFSNCELCLEAASIYAKTLSNEEEKFSFLKKAIDNAEKEILKQKITDVNVLCSLLRGYFEYAVLSMSFGRFKQALNYFEKLKELDNKDDYKCAYRLLPLYVYFEMDEKFVELYESVNDEDDYSRIKKGFPMLLYAYKKGDYELLQKTIKELDELNPSLKKIILEEVDEDNKDIKVKEALSVLRNNAFVINNCPYLISYLKGNI